MWFGTRPTCVFFRIRRFGTASWWIHCRLRRYGGYYYSCHGKSSICEGIEEAYALGVRMICVTIILADVMNAVGVALDPIRSFQRLSQNVSKAGKMSVSDARRF